MASFKYWRTQRYLDKIGKGFCLEKWHNSTLHLATGTEHGCHHVAPKNIPIKEIEEDPFALFNYTHKKQVRQQMLDGKLPAECAYCWKATGTQDRVIQSSKKYNWIDRKQITNTQGLPRYLELSFGNTCNLACAYCGPSFSSKWASEIKQYGDYSVGLHKGFAVANNKSNVYIEALISIWDTVIENLDVLKITGGEPLLSDKFFPYLQKIDNECDITINTGLGVPLEIVENFADKMSNTKNLTISVSGESTHEQAEYTRYGVTYKDYLRNFNYLRDKLPNAKFQIMSVYNSLCLESFVDFLEHISSITNFDLSISELENPKFLHHSLFDCNKEFHLQYLKRYYPTAHLQLQNILSKPSNNPDINQFKDFTREYDSRRNTNFNSIFPQLSRIINEQG